MLSLRARLAVYTGLAFAGLVLVLLVLRPAPGPLDNPAYDAIVRAHSRTLAARRDSTEKAVAVADSGAVRTVVRYRTVRQTLNIHDTVQVEQVVQAADAMADSVTILHRTIADNKRASDDVIADKDIQIARAKLQPPRLRLVASGLYDPLTKTPAAALDGEYRLTDRVSAVVRVEQRFAPGERPRVYTGGKVVL